MKIAVVGATGMVGEVMLKVLAERKFLSDTDELILQRGQWVKIDFNGKSHV
jgi:aspartate-semialdehyde dehydrogenase